MASFLVLLPPGESAEKAPEKTVFIRDGFAFWALVFGPFWLLFQRAWRAGSLTLVLSLLIAAAGDLGGFDMEAGLCAIALNIFIALEARGFAANAMERRGFRLDAVIVADDIDEAEELYFAGFEEAETAPPDFATKGPTRAEPAPSGIALMDAYGMSP
ncbi:DUF2628 domain-containing protein [Martelella sp. HB161492]|uniref:DUF2628 domain-containing protein n=1 Tax=Martelella sp. HB161492 TaxID=2720726 RepID=UPI0015924CFC|nr:DUF2628 domain-containing protein [Martelella sp. HB161492]